jgi:hypothetical protein
MEAAQAPDEGRDLEHGPHFTEEAEPEQLQAWEQVDVGRYMPRRIRGSNRGRALG